MTNLKPYGKRLIVSVIEAEERTTSGIILSKDTKLSYIKAKIIATNDTENFNVGDVVILPKHTGSKVTDSENKDFLIVKLHDVIAVVDDE